MRKRHFSIRTYAAAAATVLLALVFAIMAAGNSRLQGLYQRLDARTTAEARDRVESGLRNFVSDAQALARQIAEWDESRQQLRNPAFYNYWRDIRVAESRMQRPWLKGVELYRSDGRSLSPAPLAGMPKNIATKETSYFTSQFGQPVLLVTRKVKITGRPDANLGFLLIRTDPIKAMREQHGLGAINTGSLHLEIFEQETLPLQTALRRLRFVLTPNDTLRGLWESTETTVRSIGALALGLAVGFILLLSYLVAAPLRRLTQYIEHQKHDMASKPEQPEFAVTELRHVMESLQQYQLELGSATADLDEKNRELWDLAHHDALTGVYNRRAFDEDWHDLRATVSNRPVDISFLLFDCDRFKPLNDTYGHPVGDRVLTAIADAIGSSMRIGDRTYRLGGDEFAALLLNTDVEAAVRIAESCQQQLREIDFVSLGVNEPVRISIGIASCRGDDLNSLRDLHRHADIAMYEAKRPGGEKIVVYNQALRSVGPAHLSNRISNAVFDAVDRGTHIEMHYQPVLSLEANRTDYFEALVRIRDEQRLLQPRDIFPVVYDRRLEIEFDLAVLKRLRTDLAEDIVPDECGVSLNLSGLSLLSNKVIDQLPSLLEASSGRQLYIEVTETALITRMHQAARHLGALRKQGFKVCLDDFGSGYSSLQYLTSMPVDTVKFDMSLVQKMGDGARDGRIVEALAHMIRDAGYDLVAEGIESEDLLEHARHAGFTHVQGFHIDRPQARPH